MQTTLISSHGSHCAYDPKGGKVFKLPPNVIVLAHCDNKVVYSNTEYDGKFWGFITDAKLHLALKKEKLTVNSLGKFFEGLKTLSDELNTLCVFTDKCPDIMFQYEHKMFRSGVFQCPARIVCKDTNINPQPDITIKSETFKKIGEKNTTGLDAKQKRLALAWLRTQGNNHLRNNEQLTAKPYKPFPQENGKANMLSNIVAEIAETDPNKIHFVIAWACRAGVPVTQKLQQYSASKNPFQSAIVVYDKILKHQESKKK